MLRRWEAKDPEVYSLWETMNGWVYAGFDDVQGAGRGLRQGLTTSDLPAGQVARGGGLEEGVFYRRPDNPRCGST